ncbi:hypothetical protein K443DRAFT_465350 [Laccaria amethystina LaAM-08-1]|uniref:Uncharacterized protein n=1 Tax=Laccaria amethystina LaAM-08-1 TaxID=1095629 RepID=A0A0C9Y106_9AGAR|nr:hypothetical protein K443DRAFT_465350 [Laccaria amethystina LaAM-08-1]
MVRCEHAAGVQGFGESGMRELLRCHLLSGGICCEELERCQGNDTDHRYITTLCGTR